MDKRRKKIIMGACGLVVLIVAVVLLVTCESHREKAAAVEPKSTKAAQEESTSGTMKETEKKTEQGTDSAMPEESGSTAYSRITGHQIIQENDVSGESRQTESSEQQETWELEEKHETPERQPEPEGTTGQTEPSTTAHVHSYVLTGTKTVEHPAVTEQVWVEDSAAWDEVIREGYHMCVVTCHECGAQFADQSQSAALEAWGAHTDAAHDGDGGYDMAASYDVPAETRHHDATGHYETRIITAAWTEYIDTYRCSCGDSYTQTR